MIILMKLPLMEWFFWGKEMFELNGKYKTMEIKKYDFLIEAIQQLRSKGYTKNFDVMEEKVIERSSKKEYLPRDLGITEYHRFEGMFDPSNSSVLFAIVTNDGKRGLLTTSYSSYIDSGLMNTLEQIRIQVREN